MKFWHTDCVPAISKTKIKETMKKILLCVSLLSMFAAGFVGCSQKREWNHEQRKAMREALRSYRQMVYLDDLTDAEFVLFTDQVAGELEGTYPSTQPSWRCRA